MPKVRLQHNGKSVSIELDPDGARVSNHNPLRFRISHDVTVNTGINTWFMSRQQLEQLNLDVLTEILEAKQPGAEEAVDNAERRVAKGQQDLVKSVQQISRLTHPDVMMLIDMRQNPNQYVNSSSAFANMFNALARKVMDLSFYATLNGPNAEQQRKDFIKTTGAVTRGMDQFIYCRPNASTTNPYVNFSVIPIGQNYEDVRFPMYYNARLETKEKIPKKRFTEIYAYYVNELFDCYRRYLRMLGAAEVLPGNTDEVSADVLAEAPGDGEDPGSDSEVDDEGLVDEELDAVEEEIGKVEQEMLDSLADAPPASESASVPDVSSSAVKPPRINNNEMDAAVNKVVEAHKLDSLASKELQAAVEEVMRDDKNVADLPAEKLRGLISGKKKNKSFTRPQLREALLALNYFTNLHPETKK